MALTLGIMAMRFAVLLRWDGNRLTQQAQRQQHGIRHACAPILRSMVHVQPQQVRSTIRTCACLRAGLVLRRNQAEVRYLGVRLS